VGALGPHLLCVVVGLVVVEWLCAQGGGNATSAGRTAHEAQRPRERQERRLTTEAKTKGKKLRTPSHWCFPHPAQEAEDQPHPWGGIDSIQGTIQDHGDRGGGRGSNLFLLSLTGRRKTEEVELTTRRSILPAEGQEMPSSPEHDLRAKVITFSLKE